MNNDVSNETTEQEKDVPAETIQKVSKVLSTVSILCCIAAIVLSMLEIFGAAQTDLLNPLMGIVMLIQAFQFWESSRKVAVFSLIVAVFLFVITAAAAIMRLAC